MTRSKPNEGVRRLCPHCLCPRTGAPATLLVPPIQPQRRLQTKVDIECPSTFRRLRISTPTQISPGALRLSLFPTRIGPVVALRHVADRVSCLGTDHLSWQTTSMDSVSLAFVESDKITRPRELRPCPIQTPHHAVPRSLPCHARPP